MKPWAKAFYLSPQWRACRDGYVKSVGGLCERCYRKGLISPAEIVHHKVYITQQNINDPRVTLNWDNLEALCRECHEAEHRHAPKRWTVDKLGRIHADGEPPRSGNA